MFKKACRKRAGAGKSNKLCKKAKRRCALSKRGKKASRKFHMSQEERGDWEKVYDTYGYAKPGPHSHHLRFSLPASRTKAGKKYLRSEAPHIHRHWSEWH